MGSNVICGTILIVVLVVVAGYFLLRGPTCALQTEEPKFDLSEPFVANQGTVRSAFIGYMVNQKNEYLPIELKSISADIKEYIVLVSLNFDCAQLNYTVTKDKDKFQVTKIVAASDPEQLGGEQIKCDLDQFGFDLYGSKNKPLETKRRVFDCKNQGTKIVTDCLFLDIYHEATVKSDTQK